MGGHLPSTVERSVCARGGCMHGCCGRRETHETAVLDPARDTPSLTSQRGATQPVLSANGHDEVPRRTHGSRKARGGCIGRRLEVGASVVRPCKARASHIRLCRQVSSGSQLSRSLSLSGRVCGLEGLRGGAGELLQTAPPWRVYSPPPAGRTPCSASRRAASCR